MFPPKYPCIAPALTPIIIEKKVNVRPNNIEIRYADFNEVKNASSEDFIYFDPPYLPQTDVSFTKYSKDGFSVEDHKILSTHCRRRRTR